MKIYAQNSKGIFEFENVFIPENGPDNVIRVQGRSGNIHFLGKYIDGARARGVLLDIEAAYRRKTETFYMPLE